jgi:integrase
MPRRRLPFVQLQVTRHGRKVWYFRRDRGRRIRLPDEYGSAEFMVAYQACLAGQPIVGANRRRQAPRGKFRWLIQLYMQSQEWAGLRPGSRKARNRILQAWAQTDYDGEDITRSVILEAMAARRETPSAANLVVDTLRPMFDWAVKAGHVDSNPATGIKRLKAAKAGPDEEEGHQTWSEADLAQFERVYPLGTFERRVYAMLLYTGLRIGDAARLGRQHVQRDGSLQIRTEKRGVVVHLPIRPELEEAFEAGPHGREGELAFITAATGRKIGQAIRKERLGELFVAACKRAGLEDRSAHGIRKAAARRFAEAGATVNELMAIFGWTDAEMALKYTREADKKRLAAQAIARLQQA